MTGPQRIFVRAPNWVGDFVMASSAFARIRAAFPGARIVGGMRGNLKELQAGAPWFDEVIDTPRARGVADLRRQARILRELRCDLAIVLPNSFQTGLIPFLAGVPHRVGYRQGRSWLMTAGPRARSNRRWWQRRGPRRVPEPMPGYYDRLLDVLDLPPGPSQRPRLFVADADRVAVERWLGERGLDDGRRLVLLTVGASYGPSKLWPSERFAEVARTIARRADLAPVLLAGPAEVAVAREIAAAGGDGVWAAVDPVLSLGELAALVARGSLMITSDTGPRHLGLAFGVPVVALMGSTDPRYTAYAAPGAEVLIRKVMSCMPCQRKVCPLHHHLCMRSIEVEEVLAAVDAFLGSAP